MSISETIKRKFKKLLILFVSAVLVSLAFVFISSFLRNPNSLNGKPKDYSELLTYGTDKEMMYVTLDIADVPIPIVGRESGEEYYVLFDDEYLMYLAELTDDTYRKIEKAYEAADPETFSYTITGITSKTPKDMRDAIIEIFNEEVFEEPIDKDDFIDYFGSTYLDETYEANTGWVVVLLIFSYIGWIIAAFLLIKIILTLLHKRKTFSLFTEEDLNAAFTTDGSGAYNDVGIYLSSNRMLFLKNGPIVVPYDDIAWAYVSTRHFGYYIQKSFIMLRLKNRTSMNTKYLSTYQSERLSEVLNGLSERNSDILIGYTPENLERYRSVN